MNVFNPRPVLSTVPLPGGHEVVVADDVLLDPEGLVRWAAGQRFQAPDFPYPGLVLPTPSDLSARFADWFAQHARTRLHGRRTLAHDVRLSLVTTPPDRLDPCQWQCHRDREDIPESTVFVGSVLYLFRDPSLGGTSFFVPRQSSAATARIVADSLAMDAAQFGARYGLRAGYIAGSNAYFDCVARVPAAWNRMILYDAGIYHSGDIGRPDLLSADPTQGRLTANAFFHCRRQAG